MEEGQGKKHSTSLLDFLKNSSAAIPPAEVNRSILGPPPRVDGEESTEKKNIGSGNNVESSKTAVSVPHLKVENLRCSSDNKSVCGQERGPSRDPLVEYFEGKRKPRSQWDFSSSVFYGSQDFYEPESGQNSGLINSCTNVEGLSDYYSVDTRDNWWEGSYHY